jgi:hypothetical protein
MPEQNPGAAAREARMLYCAQRAVDDPAMLARAARIVRAAIERGALSIADLDGPIIKPSPADPRQSAA